MWISKKFLRFGVRESLVLVAVLAMLFAVLAPGLQRAFRRFEQRRIEQARRGLTAAVAMNDVRRARRALEAGAEANLLTDAANFGSARTSLLNYCIDNGRVPMVELLLVYGADVGRTEEQRNSQAGYGPPLSDAIVCKQPADVRLEMARLLIQHGADVRTKIGNRDLMDLAVFASDPKMANFLKEQGLPYGPREMAAFDQLEQLQPLVAKDPKLLRKRFNPIYAARPGQEPTLLGMALSHGSHNVAIFLIDQGAPLDVVEGLGQTLLHLAVRGGDPELIALLVARGLDVNARDAYHDTPLTDRVWNASPEVVSTLLQAGADVNAHGLAGRTALQMAVSRGRIDIISMLLVAGADPSLIDDSGKSALAEAREKGNPEILNLLTTSIKTESTSSSDP